LERGGVPASTKNYISLSGISISIYNDIFINKEQINSPNIVGLYQLLVSFRNKCEPGLAPFHIIRVNLLFVYSLDKDSIVLTGD
jgi:hypothetical protein